jgi:hypothetical protein
MRNKLPLWLKSGFIAGLPILILGALTLIPPSIAVDLGSIPNPLRQIVGFFFIIIYMFTRLVLLPLETLGDTLPFDLIGCCGEMPMPTLAGWILGLIIWFLIGALIGLSIQKRQEK